jgi:hypothetical protein
MPRIKNTLFFKLKKILLRPVADHNFNLNFFFILSVHIFLD